MRTDHISNCRIVGGDYFMFQHIRNVNKKLEEYLIKFNFSDYYCYKATDKYKLIETIEELKEFKYAQYIFFKKELYSKDNIEEWKSFLYSYKIQPKFLHKPFPPEYVKKLIKVI